MKLDFKPSDQRTAIVKTKSILELWGTNATTNFGRFGNSPSMRQPKAFKAKRAISLVTGLYT